MSLNSNNWTPFRFQRTSLKPGVTAGGREGDTAKAGHGTSMHSDVKSLAHKMKSLSYIQHQEACQYIELFITIVFLYLSGCLGWVLFCFPLKVWRNKSLSALAAKEGVFRPESCVFNPCSQHRLPLPVILERLLHFEAAAEAFPKASTFSI